MGPYFLKNVLGFTVFTVAPLLHAKNHTEWVHYQSYGINTNFYFSDENIEAQSFGQLAEVWYSESTLSELSFHTVFSPKRLPLVNYLGSVAFSIWHCI